MTYTAGDMDRVRDAEASARKGAEDQFARALRAEELGTFTVRFIEARYAEAVKTEERAEGYAKRIRAMERLLEMSGRENDA